MSAIARKLSWLWLRIGDVRRIQSRASQSEIRPKRERARHNRTGGLAPALFSFFGHSRKVLEKQHRPVEGLFHSEYLMPRDDSFGNASDGTVAMDMGCRDTTIALDQENEDAVRWVSRCDLRALPCTAESVLKEK